MGYFGSGKEIVFDKAVFPQKKTDVEIVKDRIRELDHMDVDQIRGHVIFYATLAMGDSSISEVSRFAHSTFMEKNMLMKEFAPGLQKIEQEVKQMAKEMIGLPGQTRVNLTEGGSESLYCSINSAYQWSKVNKKGIETPEIVVPYSMHAAVSKWCHYTDFTLKKVPLRGDFKADVKAMEKAITKNTIYIAGSAPCWPYGLYDPIEEIAELAVKNDIWMHVDACLGGYQAPFIEKVRGEEFPAWRLGQVPGVLSMSADIHKHGYAAKPISSIFYRDKEIQQYHGYNPSDWPDGKYSSESLMGSFPASSVASAWAVINHLGEEGYIELAKRSLEVKERYYNGINAIEGLQAWDTDIGVLLFKTEGMDTLAVLSGLIQEQCYALPCYQPMMIKIALDPVSDEVVDNFLDTLDRVVKGVKAGTITSAFLAKFM